MIMLEIGTGGSNWKFLACMMHVTYIRDFGIVGVPFLAYIYSKSRFVKVRISGVWQTWMRRTEIVAQRGPG